MKQLIFLTLILLPSITALAQREPESDLKAVTLDGRDVLLKPDHTWDFVEMEEADPSTSAVLSVTRIWEMQDACRLQFRLQNNLGYRISALVPRMTVQNMDGVIYDTKSISFTSIKPTDDKYTEIQFSGIGCHGIAHLKVFDAARCRMGEIDQWNEQEGECLSHIYVEPSTEINITK
jgi:hypothetical protein